MLPTKKQKNYRRMFDEDTEIVELVARQSHFRKLPRTNFTDSLSRLDDDNVFVIS